jgi:hypothetical protein
VSRLLDFPYSGATGGELEGEADGDPDIWTSDSIQSDEFGTRGAGVFYGLGGGPDPIEMIAVGQLDRLRSSSAETLERGSINQDKCLSGSAAGHEFATAVMTSERRDHTIDSFAMTISAVNGGSV